MTCWIGFGYLYSIPIYAATRSAHSESIRPYLFYFVALPVDVAREGLLAQLLPM